MILLFDLIMLGLALLLGTAGVVIFLREHQHRRRKVTELEAELEQLNRLLDRNR